MKVLAMNLRFIQALCLLSLLVGAFARKRAEWFGENSTTVKEYAPAFESGRLNEDLKVALRAVTAVAPRNFENLKLINLAAVQKDEEFTAFAILSDAFLPTSPDQQVLYYLVPIKSTASLYASVATVENYSIKYRDNATRLTLEAAIFLATGK